MDKLDQLLKSLREAKEILAKDSVNPDLAPKERKIKDLQRKIDSGKYKPKAKDVADKIVERATTDKNGQWKITKSLDEEDSLQKAKRLKDKNRPGAGRPVRQRTSGPSKSQRKLTENMKQVKKLIDSGMIKDPEKFKQLKEFYDRTTKDIESGRLDGGAKAKGDGTASLTAKAQNDPGSLTDNEREEIKVRIKKHLGDIRSALADKASKNYHDKFNRARDAIISLNPGGVFGKEHSHDNIIYDHLGYHDRINSEDYMSLFGNTQPKKQAPKQEVRQQIQEGVEQNPEKVKVMEAGEKPEGQSIRPRSKTKTTVSGDAFDLANYTETDRSKKSPSKAKVERQKELRFDDPIASREPAAKPKKEGPQVIRRTGMKKSISYSDNGQWSLSKMSAYGPKGGGQYTPEDNMKRKKTRTSEVREGVGRNQAVRQYTTTGSTMQDTRNKKLQAQNKKQPVKSVELSPEEKAKIEARMTSRAKDKKFASEETQKMSNYGAFSAGIGGTGVAMSEED